MTRPADVARPSLAVMMPAFNEEECIARAVELAVHCGDRLHDAGSISAFEVVVVDDGSTDRTPRLLEELATTHGSLRVVTHDANRGLGAAIRSGLRAVSSELVFYTDADLPVELTIVDAALPLIAEGSDAVCAFRLDRGGEGPRRYLYSVLYNGLVRAVLGLRVRDVNFAAKLVRSEVLDGLDLRSTGSFIDAELLARLDRRGARITQVPASYHPRSKGVSTLSSARVVVHILEEMARLTPDIRRERAMTPARAPR